MPTNRRRYTRGRRSELAELTAGLRIGLERGLWLGNDTDIDAIRDAWEIHADAILDEWEEKHPGTRPWAWWEFDAPEPRRIINPGPAGGHLDEAERKRPGRVLVGDGETPVGLVPWLEEEADYLKRLGLD